MYAMVAGGPPTAGPKARRRPENSTPNLFPISLFCKQETRTFYGPFTADAQEPFQEESDREVNRNVTKRTIDGHRILQRDGGKGT